jgi:predicted transcriptional regulator
VPTITISLPEDLKARVAAAAERTGTTTHSFILEAIAEKANREERRNDLHEIAEQRYAAIIASGKTIPWDQMRRHLEDQMAGRSTSLLAQSKRR